MTQLFDHELERQLIGAAVVGSYQPLEAWMFHDLRHRAIWKAIESVRARAGVVTAEAVELGLDNGDETYFYQIIAGTGSTLTADLQAEKLRDLASRRAIKAAMEAAMGRVIKGDDTGDIVYDLQRDTNVLGSGALRSEKVDLSDLVDELALRYADPVEVWGLRTGINALDVRFGGLHKGEVFLVAGEPGMGKSIFVAQLGFQMAGVKFWDYQEVDCVPGVIYELEMTTRATQRRIMCARARVPYDGTRTGQMAEDEFNRMMAASDVIQAAPVFISDATGWTSAAVAADVSRLIRDEGIGWAIIDYAGLLKDKADSQIDHDVTVSRALHDIAKMGVALIVVETLNKAGLRGERGAAAVRGSVQKMYDADVAAYLERDPKDKEPKSPERQLRFTKAREADMFQIIPLRLVGPQKRFEPSYRESFRDV